jgi:3D (Asp-Asp-Asp) domain-containing protein
MSFRGIAASFWRRKRTVAGALGAFLLLASADISGPGVPVRPLRLACPDKADSGDYDLGRENRFSLLPPLQVIITGYSSTVEETDSTPFLTASMTSVRPGIIALSRDLIRRYNPSAPFRFGDRVHVEGIGVFTVEDTMNERWERRADIWFPSAEEARRWGRRTLAISLVTSGEGSGGFSGREAAAPAG